MARTAYCLLTLVTLMLLSGCGRKTPPIPPHAVIPKAIEDLRFTQDESRVLLSWTYPAETTIDTKLSVIDSFQILRAVVPEDDYCATCPVPFSSVEEVKFNQAVLERRKRKASYTETVLRPGHRYIYNVRTKAGWRLISEESNHVSFVWQSPALAPQGLQVEAGDKSVSLSWQKVIALLDGTLIDAPLQYQVYRSTGKQPFVQHGEPISALGLRDAGLKNGRRYRYKVRVVQKRNNRLVYGMVSQEVGSIPKDLTAPMPPQGLSVMQVSNKVTVSWDKGHEADIAGYRVYRRASNQLESEMIAETAHDQLFLIDKTASSKKAYIYSVTAFDQAKPVNESLPSKDFKYGPF